LNFDAHPRSSLIVALDFDSLKSALKFAQQVADLVGMFKIGSQLFTAAGPAAATVLLYRAISWLGLSMLGWVIYGIWIHRSPVHLHRHVPELTAATG